MEFWEPLEFGARALLLKSTASRSREEIDEMSRAHLVRLVEHARASSEFWREKLTDVPENTFDLTDLPTSNKPELMEHFDRAVTVEDVTSRRRRGVLRRAIESRQAVSRQVRAQPHLGQPGPTAHYRATAR